LKTTLRKNRLIQLGYEKKEFFNLFYHTFILLTIIRERKRKENIYIYIYIYIYI